MNRHTRQRIIRKLGELTLDSIKVFDDAVLEYRSWLAVEGFNANDEALILVVEEYCSALAEDGVIDFGTDEYRPFIQVY